MRRTASFVFAVLTASTCLNVPSMALAQTTGLEDMVGVRAGQTEDELQRRGYRNVGGQKSDDRSYTFWWNADRRQCVTIATMNGRYDSITPSPAPDCRQPANVRPRPDYGSQNGNGYRPQPGYAPGQGNPGPGYQPGNGRPSVLPSGPIVDGNQVDIGLVCFGDGSKDAIASGTVWTWNRDRDRYDYGSYATNTTEVFDASLMVQVWGDGGRVRLPKSLIPPIHSRGSDRWWNLDNVSVGPDVIRATYRLNGLNKPRMVIDRRSGRITVEGTGAYGFRGTCDIAGAGPRRF